MININLPPQDMPTTILLKRLADGWSVDHSGLVQELVQRWAAKLEAGVEVKRINDNILQFMADLPQIHLRGMNNVPCLVISGGDGTTSAARDFCQKVSLPRLLPFIFALTPATQNMARTVFPAERCLILSVENVKQMLGADDPHLYLKELLREQIPKRRLSPYNIIMPAEKGMFFGRDNELGRLCDEDLVSFAIAGPGRIGKTSLIRHYKDVMLRRRDPRSASRFYISFFDCADTTPDGVARFLAMSIDSSSRSSKTTAQSLVNFLRYHCKTFGSPLDLLLDEVDPVCENGGFHALSAAARLGFCRLVLCGKGGLLKAILDPRSNLECRLDLIQLEPLDKKSARSLLLKPLVDLGFKIDGPDELADRVLRLTGCLPYLLQFYGQQLVELAIEEDTDTISMQHIEMLKWDFVTAQYFVKPLNDLEDPETRLVGLSLLKYGEQEFSVPAVQAIGERVGLRLGHKRATEICNDLVINNVLVWKGGSYCIATEGLNFYAREMGYLNSALEESLTQVRHALDFNKRAFD